MDNFIQMESSSSLRLTTALLAVVVGGGTLALTAHRRRRNHPDQQPQGDTATKSKTHSHSHHHGGKGGEEDESWESHVTEHDDGLEELWPGTLYRLQAKGCEMGPPVRNMILYRVPARRRATRQEQHFQWIIYNAIAVNEETLSEILKLGTPSVMIVPNCYHRCCAGVWKKRFPFLKVVCPQVARSKVEEVVSVDMSTKELCELAEWKNFINVTTIDGWGDFEDVVQVELEHDQQNKSDAKKKRAIMVCDMLFTVPINKDAGFMERLMVKAFDSSIELPPTGEIIVPKVARLSRIFAIKDWNKAEAWYRSYAKDNGAQTFAILVGHGPPVVEVKDSEGCTKALNGIADQLAKPRW